MPQVDTRLSGLASGFDWKEVVDRLMEVESIPLQQLEKENEKNAQKMSGLDDLKAKLKNLQTAAKSLESTYLYKSRSATVLSTTGDSSQSAITANAAPGTLAGSYAFNVTRLATASVRSGTSNVSKPISTTADVSGVTLSLMPTMTPVTAGTFIINGAKVSIATSDSLQNVFAKVNTATNGVVSMVYNPTTDKVSVSSSSTLLLGSGADTSNFLSALQLFSNGTATTNSRNALGSVQLNNSIANANLVAAVTDGSFSINGVSFSYTTANDLYSLMGQVNSSSAGVFMSYDIANRKFALTNKTTGSSDIVVADSNTSGGLMSALGLTTNTTSLGQDATFTVNGGSTLYSKSNTFDASSHGIAGLEVTANESNVSGTVVVSASADNARAQINSFITQYNEAQKLIESDTKVTFDPHNPKKKIVKSLFSGDHDIENLGNNLRNIVFGTVAGLDSGVTRLMDMGLDFKKDSNELEVKDSSKLNKSLTENGELVGRLFTHQSTGNSDPNGIAYAVDSFIDGFADSQKGTIYNKTEALKSQRGSIDNQIEAKVYALSRQREKLTNSFLQMETMQSRLHGQMEELMRFISRDLR